MRHNLGMSRQHPQLHVRLDPSLKSRLEDEAWKNRRTLNAEIIARLEASFDPAADPQANALLAEFGRFLVARHAAAGAGD